MVLQKLLKSVQVIERNCMKIEISNFKSQKTNNTQIPMTKN